MGIKLAQKENKKEENSSSFWAFMNKDISIGTAFSAKRKQAFYEELGLLLRAGLDLQTALELLKENLKKKKEQEILARLLEEIISGARFFEALQRMSVFSTYECYSIQIAEESGQLQAVLKELAAFFRKSLKYRQQLISALSYPIFVMSFSFLALFFLLRYLVPMFAGIYERFGSELPYLTRLVVQASDYSSRYGGYILLLIIGAILFLYSQKQAIWWRKWRANILLFLPIFGPIIRRIYLARFAQSMALLLGARLPLLQAMDLLDQMIDFYPLESILKSARDKVLQGNTLAEALAEGAIFSNQFLALIRVGEEAGQLGPMFGRLAEQYNEEIEQRTAIIGSLLEPILIVALGLMVAVILVAMYLPLFQLSTSIGF